MEPRRLVRRLVVLDDFVAADESDRAYWLSLTPAERLEHLEELRRANYGDAAATGGLQRVLEVASRSRG